MKHLNFATKAFSTLIGTLGLTFFAHAGVSQDCMLEGTVKKAETKGHQNIIRIDFDRPKPFSADSHCRYSGKVNFTQPKGHRLESLPAGSTVRYRFQSDEQGEQWTLVETTI